MLYAPQACACTTSRHVLCRPRAPAIILCRTGIPICLSPSAESRSTQATATNQSRHRDLKKALSSSLSRRKCTSATMKLNAV
eukprot:4020330-Pleurochrysis_carterae.AAC.2